MEGSDIEFNSRFGIELMGPASVHGPGSGWLEKRSGRVEIRALQKRNGKSEKSESEMRFNSAELKHYNTL
jgi:hypothetical protein